jgi:hypothetical protein
MRDADSDDEIHETVHEQEEILEALDVSDDEESDIDVDEGFDWIEIPFDADQKEPDFKVHPNHVGIKMRFLRMTLSTALHTFLMLFTIEMINIFIEATNEYGRTYILDWQDLTIDEFKRFLCIILLLGVNKYPSRKIAWSTSIFGSRVIRLLMPRTRFELVLRAWRYRPDDPRAFGRESPFRAVKRFLSSIS